MSTFARVLPDLNLDYYPEAYVNNYLSLQGQVVEVVGFVTWSPNELVEWRGGFLLAVVVSLGQFLRLPASVLEPIPAREPVPIGAM